MRAVRELLGRELLGSETEVFLEVSGGLRNLQNERESDRTAERLPSGARHSLDTCSGLLRGKEDSAAKYQRRSTGVSGLVPSIGQQR